MRTFFHTPGALYDFPMDARDMWVTKTLRRLGDDSVLSVVPEVRGWLQNIAEECLEHVKYVVTMHGDLHLGNVIYDPYADRITLIDPRGKYGEWVTRAGDSLYDLAKMSHDAYHGFGEIVNGGKYPPFLKQVFMEMLEKYYPEYDPRIVNDAGALLMARCVPLHGDDRSRQDALRRRVTEYLEATG